MTNKVHNENKDDQEMINRDEIAIEDFLRVMYKGKFIVLLTIIIFTCISIFYVSRQKVTYKSTMRFVQNNDIILNFNDSVFNVINSDSFSKELINSKELRNTYAKQNSKSLESITDDEMKKWISQSNVVVATEKLDENANADNKKIKFVYFDVVCSGTNTVLNTALANSYYDALSKVLNTRQGEYISQRIDFLEKKINLLRQYESSNDNKANGLNQGMTAYQKALDELTDMKLQRDFNKNSIALLNSAGEKVQQESVSKKKYLIVGIGGGIVFGLILAYLWDFIKVVDWKKIKK